MKKQFLLLFASLILFSSCTLYHIDSQDISLDVHPSKQSIDEVVYLETIDQPHEIIAYITVNAERRQRISEILERMRREAAILGADAITNIKSDATGQWKSLPVQDLIGNAYVRANFSASAVAFK